VADQRLAIQVRCDQFRVTRLHAAVAAHIQIPALFRRDDADVLALRLGAFARAARHRELQLVRRTQAFVAVLDIDRETDGIVDAIAAPRRAHARLHRAHRFAVRVARLETGGDQFFPDRRQLLDARAEQIDALSARDLRIEAILLCDLTHGD